MDNTQILSDEFRIYRFGKLDKAFMARKYGGQAARLAGRTVKTAALFAIDVLDQLVTEFDKL